MKKRHDKIVLLAKYKINQIEVTYREEKCAVCYSKKSKFIKQSLADY